MKKIFFILAIITLMSLPAMSQKINVNKNNSAVKQELVMDNHQKCDKNVDKKELHEKMMKQKYEIYNKVLELKPEEQEKFWKIYTEYDNDVFACHEKFGKIRDEITKDLRDNDGDIAYLKLNEEQAEELLMQKQEMERQLLDINESYMKKFHEILPPQKILQLQQEEKHFMRQLMSGENPKLGENIDERPNKAANNHKKQR
jgi:hypothetical protein